MDDYSKEILASLQANLTELAQGIGMDPDGMDDDSVIRAINRRFDDLKSVNADLLAALKAVEWIEHTPHFHCESCGQEREDGHEPDCIVGLAIAKAEGEVPT